MADLDLNATEPQHVDYDLDELSARLADRAAEWVPQLYPRGRIAPDRKELRLANIGGDPPRNHGSCAIALKGEEAGCWWEFDGAKGGGPLDTLAHATGLFGRELYAQAARMVGEIQRRGRPAKSNGPARSTVADHIAEAIAIWNATQEPLGSPTEAYLASRRVGLPPTLDLRHSASLSDYRGHVARQGMVARIRNAATSEPTGGIHRTYLLDDGRPAKEEMGGKHKLALGPAQLAGGVVMLAPMTPDGRLGVAEGIETALAVTEIDRCRGNTDPLPTWATLGDWGMANMPLPPGLKTLLIFADAGKAGIAAAEKLQDRALAAGIQVRCYVPRSGDDFARDLELGLWELNREQQPSSEPRPETEAPVLSVPPQTLEHILAAAAELSREVSPKATGRVLFVLRGIALAKLDPLAERQVLDAIKSKTGMPIGDLRRTLAGLRRDIGTRSGSSWSSQLILGDDGSPRGDIHNAILALEEDAAFAGALRYDRLRTQAMRTAPVPWDQNPQVPAPWRDQDDREAQVWLHQRDIFATLEVTRDAVQTVAERRGYHPIMNYFNAIHWNGEPRLDRWLISYVGCEDTEVIAIEVGGQILKTSYVQAVGARWLIAGAARIFEPGCKFDNALVLEGGQGILKSTVFDVLGGPFYTNDIAALGTKDAQEQILGTWIVELDELEAVTRAADVASVKSFVSRRVDRFRHSYGRRVESHPRQCIFGGTVNRQTWQRDETGGRRWWPVCCGKIDIEALRADRDQLWAEARDRYLGGERWWLDEPELIQAAEAEQEKRFEPDVWEGKVAQFLQILTDVRVEDILGPRCLDIPVERWGRAEQMRIGAILRHLGWTKERARPPGGGAPRWKWIRSA